MRLFRNTSVSSAFFTFIRQTEEGGSTDSRPSEARKLIALGAASQAVHDEILEGFVSDPAVFAAAVSRVAGASLPQATISSLLATESIDGLRELAGAFDPSTIETSSENLAAFIGKEGDLDPDGKAIDCVMNAGPDGRAWIMLVAAHLTLLRANREIRTLIYPFNQPK